MRVKYIQNCLRRKVFGEFMVDFMYEFRILVYICKICKLRYVYKWKFPHWVHLRRFYFHLCFFLTSLHWCEGIRKLIFLHISVSRRFFFYLMVVPGLFIFSIYFFCNKIKKNYLNIRKLFTSQVTNLNINHITSSVNVLINLPPFIRDKKKIANIFHLTYLSDIYKKMSHGNSMTASTPKRIKTTDVQCIVFKPLSSLSIYLKIKEKLKISVIT